ncbi:MAG: glycosyltransferase [Planctomycetota bacterium]
MHFSKIKTLVLYAGYTRVLSYFEDWSDAFIEAEEFEITVVNIANKNNLGLVERTVKNYDFIVILHSAFGDTLDYISHYKNILRERPAKLMVFVGNEVNYPPPLLGVHEKIVFLQSIKPDFIATQLPLETGQKLYEDITGAGVVDLPHALNPKRFSPAVSQSARKIDIGVRTHKYYPFIGDNERTSLVEYFVKTGVASPLRLDVSTDYRARFSSGKWSEFLNKCKGTLATEAGSYYLEKDDATVIKIAGYIKNRCGPLQKYSFKFEERYKKFIPVFFKSILRTIMGISGTEERYGKGIYYSVGFEEIYERFFKNYLNSLNGKCISSRHFEAIGTKTCQIMFPGRFNGILEADKHYLSLNLDFSNIKEVLEKFRDLSYRTKLVDDAYEYVMSHHTYRHRIKKISGLFK